MRARTRDAVLLMIGIGAFAVSCAGDPLEAQSASNGDSTSSGATTMGTSSATTLDATTDTSGSATTVGPSETGDAESTGGDTTTGAMRQCEDSIVAAGELCLSVADTYPVEDQPRSIAAGDFNDDGHIDLVVGADNSSAFTVFIGAGDGTFMTDPVESIAGRVNDVFADDINLDGYDDAVLVDKEGRQLVAYLSDGQRPAVPFATYVTDKPRRVVLVDIDGDIGSTPDAVMTLDDQDGIRVALGNGTGSFVVQPMTAVGAGPTRLAVGDIDGDTDVDVVTANDAAKTATVLFNNAGLVADAHYDAENNPSAASLADFDGDDDLDILLTNAGSDSMTLWLNNGAGAFMDSSSIVVGDEPRDLVAADFDADGIPDAAACHAKGDDNVAIFVSDGAGGFSGPRILAVGNDPSALVAGDFNEDDALDIAVVNFGDDDVTIILSNP